MPTDCPKPEGIGEGKQQDKKLMKEDQRKGSQKARQEGEERVIWKEGMC